MTTPSQTRLDLLFFHGWRIADDPREQEVMRPFPPLGIQYLVAFLREDWAVDWFDATWAPSFDALYRRFEEDDPRVIGLYGHTVTRPVALPLIAAAHAQGRRTIAGGPDPVQYVDEYLDGGVEVIVVGEGEHTVAALLQHLAAHDWQWDLDGLSAIAGIIFRSADGSVVRTPPRPLIRPLDQLPQPARDHRDVQPYLDAWRQRHGETAMSITTSRGCPYHCTWCSKQVYGDTFRRREVDAVIDEVLSVKERFDVDQIWFVDDMFTINRRWVHRFADRMVARNAVTPFYIIGRPETLDLDMLQALKRAGCFRIYISAESGAQHVLDAMRKESTVDAIYRAGRLMREVGIELGVFVMIGYPGEELDDIRATLQMLHDLDPAVTLLSVAHPMKGTQFYDDVADAILPSDRAWTEAHGGRLRFRMRFSPRFYDVAQRYIWTETGLVRKLRAGSVDRQLLKLAAKYPVYRAAFELLGRQPRPSSSPP